MTLTLDELLEKHPAPWVCDLGDDVYRDANRQQLFGIYVSPAMMDAVNRIHEMRGEMERLKDENERLVGIVNRETNLRRDVHAENERLKDDISDVETDARNMNVQNDALKRINERLRSENAALKARVSLLENTIYTWRRCDDDVRESRRFEAALAIRAHDGCSAERAVEEAEDLLAAVYGQERPSVCPDKSPEPPAAEVWRIDEGCSRVANMFQWFIENTDDGEYSFGIEFAERHLVNRIVSALNGGESC